MQSGIARRRRDCRFRIGVIAQRLRIELAAVKIELTQLPIQQRLRAGRQPLDRGAANCIDVWLRMRFANSRISIALA
jgi:hypothetical protein